MSKSSRITACTKRAAGWWEGSCKGYSEWTCEGSPKLEKRVGAYGCPSRYQQVYMLVYKMSGRFIRQCGWHRRSEQLLSLSRDKGVFYLYSLFFRRRVTYMSKGRFWNPRRTIHSGNIDERRDWSWKRHITL